MKFKGPVKGQGRLANLQTTWCTRQYAARGI